MGPMSRTSSFSFFYFSLAPSREFSFRPAAWADHNILRFHAGSELVEVAGKSNVLQESDYGTVWVYHVPESANRWRDRAVSFYCADDVGWLLRAYNKKVD